MYTLVAPCGGGGGGGGGNDLISFLVARYGFYYQVNLYPRDLAIARSENQYP